MRCPLLNGGGSGTMGQVEVLFMEVNILMLGLLEEVVVVVEMQVLGRWRLFHLN